MRLNNTEDNTAARIRRYGYGLIERSVSRFARDEDGAMIIFGIMIFGLMLAIGGLSFDLMRYEAHRERLQSTLDRAVLAAASLNQELEPKDVVVDYFAKAGLSNYIDEQDIIVTEDVNFRRVEATAHINVVLHHGHFAKMGQETGENILVAEAHSIAEESIGNVEISLVLDVSGSMNSYSRLTNLKTAAKDFIDTVYDSAQPDAVSTSIIPYATQVNAGENLIQYFTRNLAHVNSGCLNFTTSDFSTAAMSLVTPYDQTIHFDPWTDENDSFDLGETPDDPVCGDEKEYVADGSREILPWATNKTTIKNYIDDFSANGNTSTDIGAKWGAALLDPSLQSVLTSMIGTNDVDATMAGRPYAYEDNDSLKIMVIMTDGEHTSQYYMHDDYRDGMSFVWRYEDDDDNIHYSVWWDGENGTPITDPSGNYSYCDRWDHGYCEDWDYDDDPEFWFHAVSYNGSYNTYGWRKSPYDAEAAGEGTAQATQMTWEELWTEIPPEYFSDEVLWEMESMYSSERNQYEYAIDYVGSSTKDTRLSNICSAAKTEDVIIFTIGLQVSSSHDDLLENCATVPGNYYDVNNLNIAFAFQSIASSINHLRLIQ